MSTFDSSALLAAYLHPQVCAGHETLIEPRDCLAVRAALPQWLDKLHAAGMGLVPLATVTLLERLFDHLVGSPAGPGPEQPVASNSTAARALAATFIEISYHDGRVEREGPHQRWLAEMLLGDLNFHHTADMRSAILIPEPAWIAILIDSLAQIDKDDVASS